MALELPNTKWRLVRHDSEIRAMLKSQPFDTAVRDQAGKRYYEMLSRSRAGDITAFWKRPTSQRARWFVAQARYYLRWGKIVKQRAETQNGKYSINGKGS